MTVELIEPPRPTPEEVEAELTAHIQALAGPDARPRPEQLDAVTAVVSGRKRTLLANPGFRERVFSMMLSRPFALVCDEGRCISDWGHDFRPAWSYDGELAERLGPFVRYVMRAALGTVKQLAEEAPET